MILFILFPFRYGYTNSPIQKLSRIFSMALISIIKIDNNKFEFSYLDSMNQLCELYLLFQKQ